MVAYIIRKLLNMIPIVLGVALLTFILFTTVGEDPVRVALGNHATPDAIADLRANWGLDQPVHLQFLDFLRQIVTFDFDPSFNTGEELLSIFNRGALISLSLTFPPFLIGTVLYLVIAVLIAYYRGSWIDRWSTVFFVASMSISYLVYVIVLQYVLAYQLDLFPINGFERGMESVFYLSLPWIITVVVAAGPDIRIYRTVFLDETKSDYVRTALAKGATERRVLFKHIMKNAMIPVLTYTVTAIPFLILGAFILERFFSIPGLGDAMINAVNTGDFPVLKGFTILLAIAFTLFNLLTDILYAYVDPRVKLE
jgi:peptide/nickel transport system permease protein